MIQTQSVTQDWALHKGCNVWKTLKNEQKSGKEKHFSKWFFTHSLPVSSSKFLQQKTFTLLKSCYLLGATFCKSNCILWVIYSNFFFYSFNFWDSSYKIYIDKFIFFQFINT